MKTLIFILLLNSPDGSQVETYKSEPMTFDQCDKLQRGVWALEFPTVAVDENGDIPAVDAACLGTEL